MIEDRETITFRKGIDEENWMSKWYCGVYCSQQAQKKKKTKNRERNRYTQRKRARKAEKNKCILCIFLCHFENEMKWNAQAFAICDVYEAYSIHRKPDERDDSNGSEEWSYVMQHCRLWLYQNISSEQKKTLHFIVISSNNISREDEREDQQWHKWEKKRNVRTTGEQKYNENNGRA